jgi:hypothetical protein
MIMRAVLLTIAAAAALLTGCTRDRRGEPAARQAGREAHRAADDLKRGAEKAAAEARHAGREFREGWKEGKHDPPPRDDRRPRR